MKVFTVKFIFTVLLHCILLTDSAIELDPQVVYACNGEVIGFTCTSTESSALEWTITIPGETAENIIISSTQAVSTISVQIDTHAFVLARTFSNPLASTLTTTSSSLINDTVVQCSAGTSGTRRAHIITLNIGIPSLQELHTRPLLFGNNIVSVLLSWIQNTNKGNVTYSFEIDPPVSEMFLSGTNILLHMLYNTLYNVTIFATNCEGTAHNFSEIYYADCGIPFSDNSIIQFYYNSTTEGSRVLYRCGEGLIPSTTIISECRSNGSWVPDTSVLTCSGQKPDSCSFPQPPRNGVITNVSGTNEGRRVQYRCNEGYMPVGEMTAFCLANGSWQQNPPFTLMCTKITRDDDTVLITALSSLLSGIICFVLGVFVGMLCLACLKGHLRCFKSSNTDAGYNNQPNPTYEEVNVPELPNRVDFIENVSYVRNQN